MKTYSLLRLEHNANKVIFTTIAESVKHAAEKFNRHLKGVQLDNDGYAKFTPTVSFCVAENYEPLSQV